jgi:hypothetical protein
MGALYVLRLKRATAAQDINCATSLFPEPKIWLRTLVEAWRRAQPIKPTSQISMTCGQKAISWPKVLGHSS